MKSLSHNYGDFVQKYRKSDGFWSQVVNLLAENLPLDGPSDDLLAVSEQVLNIGLVKVSYDVFVGRRCIVWWS